VDNGTYTVSIATPIGYQADEETKEIIVSGEEHEVNFELTQLEVIPDQRSRGYWMHQVNALLSGKGKPHETYEEMCEYMELIRTHFNEHQLNPIDIFSVDLNAACDTRLEALRDVISPKAKATMEEKAKAHFVSLLLNMVSGKIAQWTSISGDDATVSQAITYCNTLITDGDPANDERAKDIMEMINDGEIVPAGWIDLSTPDIAYKQTDGSASLPSEFSVSQNYPNPFNANTLIGYTLAEDSPVRLEVYDILGRQVALLFDGIQSAGHHEVAWDGRDPSGRPVASGTYFYRLTAGDIVATKKMVLLK
jgi:hypothetical protein